jgi:hypothetical protein
VAGKQADGVLVAENEESEKDAVDDADSTTRAVAKCDGKSLVHISMRPERRQPTQIGSPTKISRGQEQGFAALVDGAWANNAGRTGLIEMDREQAAGTVSNDPLGVQREVSLGIQIHFPKFKSMRWNAGMKRHGRQPCMDESSRVKNW